MSADPASPAPGARPCEKSPDGKHKPVFLAHIDYNAKGPRCSDSYRCEHCGKTTTQYLGSDGRTWREPGTPWDEPDEDKMKPSKTNGAAPRNARADVPPISEDMEIALRCPECGGALEVKTNRKTGHQFLGCARFSRGCEFTQEIPESLRMQAAGAPMLPFME